MSDAEHFNAESGDTQQPDEQRSNEQQPEEQQSNGNMEDASDLELFEQYLDQDMDFDMPGRGDLREGVIVEVRPSELLVNVGSKRDGVVPQSDLSRLDSEFVKNLQEGQVVDVVITRQPDDDGIFTLSMADALQQRDWITAQEQLESGEISEHQVIGFNKGGLTVEYRHLRGFVPASHVVDMPRNLSEDQRREELEGRIGQSMRLKVIEVEKRRRRLVMSQSLAERELQASRREELFKTLNVGDVIHGEVRSLRPFGAFVDIGGADGLLHVSEIGWANVNHPREELEVGEKIDVEVIRVEPENQRIALSRKRLLPNPWDTVEERYQAGEVVPAKITRIVDFGAFAELEPGIEGLIHISEIADISVAEPLKTVRVGDEVRVKVLRVDRKRQRVGLSLRQVDDGMPAETAEAAEEIAEESTQAAEEVAAEAAQEESEAPEAQETSQSTASDAPEADVSEPDVAEGETPDAETQPEAGTPDVETAGAQTTAADMPDIEAADAETEDTETGDAETTGAEMGDDIEATEADEASPDADEAATADVSGADLPTSDDQTGLEDQTDEDEDTRDQGA